MQEVGNLKITKIWTFFEVSDLQLHSTFLKRKTFLSLKHFFLALLNLDAFYTKP